MFLDRIGRLRVRSIHLIEVPLLGLYDDDLDVDDDANVLRAWFFVPDLLWSSYVVHTQHFLPVPLFSLSPPFIQGIY